ncbi:DEAD/DEAH box helicase [Aestuariimicrobium soli]|uniref:DEAD/DEAH box helicase n=1 Tax=Aestuariimicrobium soli TaxID=2035834 RepID=UPI003EC13E77
MSGFDRLTPSLQHHIVNDLGWGTLRALQEQAVEPLLAGHDALLLAPTAGGKTEAALFPLLTRMSGENWRGTSVLYITPLKALVNNLQVRAERYTGWLGRTSAVRHGDTTAGQRKRRLLDHPDVLLTTPESIEAMLISTTTDPRAIFSGVQAVVIDEIHAFAGDDRGWHLLGVLQRLEDLVGHPLQRVGLSATVGNAEWLLGWLQGNNRDAGVPGVLVNPAVTAGGPAPDVQLDFVGSLANAATVIASLHQGEKRLVSCESRRQVEELAERLGGLGVTTFVSHSSVSPDDRRRAEEAFAQERDCVIVATSTLELGIDVGDLDRVVQIGSTPTVASLLQRLGRTGRRLGTVRNMLVLGIKDDDFLRAAGIALLWGEGYVEPLVPPPEPLHIVAQQALGITIQQRTIGQAELVARLQGLGWVDDALVARIVRGLEELGHLDRDRDLLFIGPTAEGRYGRTYFRDLMAAFTAPPQFLVLHGRADIGYLEPLTLLREVEGPRFITLGGRPCRVTHVDWTRRRCHVEPADHGGVVRWQNSLPMDSPQLCYSMRRVLLGVDPVGVRLSQRAAAALARLREQRADEVDATSTRVVQRESDARWWNRAGGRRNLVLATALARVNPELMDGKTSFGDAWIGLRAGTTMFMVQEALVLARLEFGAEFESLPIDIDDDALMGLKFSDLLPDVLARWELERRLRR